VFNLFRHCRKDEISFDIVAETGDIVAKNTMLPVSATISLVWTGLKGSKNKTGQTDGRTDGRQTVTLLLPLDAASKIRDLQIIQLLTLRFCYSSKQASK